MNPDRNAQRQLELELASNEGLIFTTARMIQEVRPELEMDDIQQRLRIKVWKAIRAFDPAKARGLAKANYIFMCVQDEKKSILRLRRHDALKIEDIAYTETGARDAFDAHYLSTGHDTVFREVEDEMPNLPDLEPLEHVVVIRLYQGQTIKAIADDLEISRKEVDLAVKSVREKLAHLRD